MAQKVGPAARRLDDLATAIEGDGRGGQTVDKVAVVADEDQGAVIVRQHVFEQVQRIHIQIVGRLIEDHQIGGRGQGLGQQEAVTLAARQAGDRLAKLAVAEQEVLGIGGNVAGIAAHHDLVAAIRSHHVPEGVAFLQSGAGLIDIENFKV